MDRIKKYQNIIKTYLENWLDTKSSQGIMPHLSIDEENTDYILLHFGWSKNKYTHGITFHVQIKDDKVWIHQDNTDVDIASILVENGIPKKDIVLGFLNPKIRQFSDYAAA